MKGLDLCYHQGDIDWKQVAQSGIEFIIPRDGWGTDSIDPKLIQNVKEAQDTQIAVSGVYHFIYAVSLEEAIQNAVKAVSNVQKAGLPKSTVIWCDLEEDTLANAQKLGVTLSNQDIRKSAEAFCNYCLSQGYCTGIYLNADYLINRYGKGIMNEYDIWFADPSGAFDYPCLYKQTDWYAKIPGISTNVDTDIYVGEYTAGTAKPKEHNTGGANMAHVVYTEKQLTDILRTLASGKSSYKNSYPYNLLYWDGSRWWADCVNLYKALFNGRSIVNPAVGSYQKDLSNTGDVTEWGLLSQCTDVSTDFSKLGNKFRCLYKHGHFGGYLGFEWTEPNQGIVNCVESTPAWEDGIQFSYVDKSGNRFWAKGKNQLGAWTHHGLATKWIDYSDSKEYPAPAPTPKKNTLTVAEFIPYLGYVAKGSEGDIVLMLQKILKNFGYYDGYLDGECGEYTIKAIKAIQADLGVLVDGSFGPACWTALIK